MLRVLLAAIFLCTPQIGFAQVLDRYIQDVGLAPYCQGERQLSFGRTQTERSHELSVRVLQFSAVGLRLQERVETQSASMRVGVSRVPCGELGLQISRAYARGWGEAFVGPQTWVGPIMSHDDLARVQVSGRLGLLSTNQTTVSLGFEGSYGLSTGVLDPETRMTVDVTAVWQVSPQWAVYGQGQRTHGRYADRLRRVILGDVETQQFTAGVIFAPAINSVQPAVFDLGVRLGEGQGTWQTLYAGATWYPPQARWSVSVGLEQRQTDYHWDAPVNPWVQTQAGAKRETLNVEFRWRF